MPPTTFLSNIPVLGATLNAVNNLFTDDNSLRNTNGPQSEPNSPSSPTNASPGPSKFAQFFSTALQSPSLSSPSKPSEPGKMNRTDTGEVAAEDSPSPTPSRRPVQQRKGSTIVIDTPDQDSDGGRGPRSVGRPRGMSTASTSGGVGAFGPDGRRRTRKVETYVLVKPPPTANKNPLNLQVQLVMNVKPTGKRGRAGSDATRITVGEGQVPDTPGRQSFDLERSTTTTTISDGSDGVLSPGQNHDDQALPPVAEGKSGGLKRSGSLNSTTSSSIGSAITVSGSKRIIPLYNLAVHNVVQPTVVTDAGTDSRVAKFLKRSLDISGVGILEPVEVWLPLPGGVAGSPRPSIESGSRRPTSMMLTSTLSPAPSRVEDKRASMDTRPVNNLLSPADDGRKKFFGKIFRKRGSADPLNERRASRVLSGIPSSKSQTFLSVEAAAPASAPLTPASPAAPLLGEGPLGHTTFGLAPTIYSRTNPDAVVDRSGAIVGLSMDTPAEGDELVALSRSSRPIGYTWTVRKWAKKNTEGWAAHIVAAAAAGLDLVAGALPGDGADEVVFEWVKLRVTPSTPGAELVIRGHPAFDGMPLGNRLRRSTTTNSVFAADSPNPSPSASRVSLVPSRSRAVSGPAGVALGDTNPNPTLHAAVRNAAVTASANASETALASASGTPAAANAKLSAPDTNGSPASSAKASPPRRRRESLPKRQDSSGSGSAVPSGPGSSNGDMDEPIITVSEAGSVQPPLLEVPDDGDDSDPEDSETSWACSVWVRRTGQRQLLATLTPAPHHPKVIGVLKMPTGIRSVSLANLADFEKTPNAAGSDIAARVKAEVCLTEENIKDVVSVTAMWLVAREEFGGLGRKKRV